MSNGMIPCQNPALCGVRNHRPGTQARCKQSNTGSGATGRISAAPKLASSYTPGEYDDYDDRDYPVTTPDKPQEIIDQVYDYDDRDYPAEPKPVVQTYSDYDYDDRD